MKYLHPRIVHRINKITNYVRKYSSCTDENKVKYESVVGLEIHAQISSSSKLFSAAPTTFSNSVNTNVALFDVAIPGTLPVLNRRCVEAAVLTALALSCDICPVSTFDRKHYFYPDLPAGYQITQFYNPIAKNGKLKFEVFNPSVHIKACTKTSCIKQLQLEQDSGKSLYDDVENRTLIDLNRAGVALMEIVFEPDLSDGEEAAALVKELILILKKLQTCSCKMEEGALRVDANVSIHLKGQALGPRTEIKNIGSVRGVAAAINYEIARQKCVVMDGEKVINETRAWDADNKMTVPMRDKEEKQDYRYMPESNLSPLYLKVDQSLDCIPGLVSVDELRKCLPELPDTTRKDIVKKYNLPLETAIILVNEDILLEKFTVIMKSNPNRSPKLVASMLIVELLTVVNKKHLDLKSSITNARLGELIDLLEAGRVNLLTARDILTEMVLTNVKSAEEIIKVKNLSQINDDNEIEFLCKTCIDKNPKLVKEYKAGKTKVFNALLGNIAQLSQKRANMSLASQKLKELLKK